MYCKDLVTNLSTALMAVKDMATYNDIPIEMHFENHYIHIFVGYGTPYQKYVRFYPQDCYRAFANTDDIRKWIENAIEEIQKEKSKYMVEIGEKIHEGVEKALEKEKKIDWKKANPNFYPEDRQFGVADAIIFKAPDGYHADWTPPELEKLGIPYPATQEDIEKALKIEHLWDVTCSWQLEELCGRRLYILMPDCTLDDLTPYERLLLEQSEEYEKKHKE